MKPLSTGSSTRSAAVMSARENVSSPDRDAPWGLFSGYIRYGES